MDAVITLIADGLDKPAVDSMLHLLTMQGITIDKTEWLKDKACDLYTRQASIPRLDEQVRDALQDETVDAIVQQAAGRRRKLLIADMESTIITCECLDELAEYVGLKDKIAAITARAMNGEIQFENAITERVALLKGLPESALQEVHDKKVRFMPGAKQLVASMRANGAYCMLVSGGFDFFAERVARELGFDEYRANTLEIAGGKLTGRIAGPILGKEAKLAALKDACARRGITPQDALAVGDGANDLPMLMEAGLGVAYHAKPSVRASAKARIDHSDLRALLWAQGIVT
jgi:phosphoserine phosphatase